jgi:hypothetical protein
MSAFADKVVIALENACFWPKADIRLGLIFCQRKPAEFMRSDKASNSVLPIMA